MSAEHDTAKMALVNERDRYLGFAFASAHLLLETDTVGRIRFALGARCRLTEGNTASLSGKSLLELVEQKDRGFVQQLLVRCRQRQRINPSRVVFKTFDSQHFAALLGGCCLPHRPDTLYLAVLLSDPARPYQPGADGADEALMDEASFAQVLEERLVKARTKGLDRNLTLLSVSGLGEFVRESGEGGKALGQRLDSYLRAVSADGDSAGKLADDRFGVIHGSELTEKDIQEQMAALIADSGGQGLTKGIQTWKLSLEDSGLGQADATRALVYAVQSFATAAEGEFSMGGLEDGARQILDQTVQRMTSLRKTLDDRAFYVVYQPIVGISDRKLHHLEALTRLEGASSPQEFITFAEQVGMIPDFDLLLCKTVLDTMKDHFTNPNLPGVAVNVSARSLSSTIFVTEFRRLIASYGAIHKHLLIEVTETVNVTDFSTLNKVLQVLRADGHEICLDDVGAGGTSFQSLYGLQVDIAKIDGQFVRGALTRKRDMALLRSMVDTCLQLGLAIVAEQVEDEEQASLLRGLGVTLGQGWLYGRPSANFALFTRPPGKAG